MVNISSHKGYLVRGYFFLSVYVRVTEGVKQKTSSKTKVIKECRAVVTFLEQNVSVCTASHTVNISNVIFLVFSRASLSAVLQLYLLPPILAHN